MSKYAVDYTPYYRETPPKKVTGHSKRYIKSRRLHVILIMVIVLCFSVTLLGLDYLSGGYVLSDFDTPTASQNFSYYCVQTGQYENKQTAEYYAHNTKDKGGAGFVYLSEDYRVIASVYGDEAQANKISNRLALSGLECRVFCLTISPIYDGTLSPQTRDSFTTASKYFDQAYLELYDASNGLDQEIYSMSEIRQRIKRLKEVFLGYVDDLSALSQSESVLKLSANIKATISILENIPTSFTSSDLRHAYVSILVSATH